MGGPLVLHKGDAKRRFEEEHRAHEYSQYKNKQDEIDQAIKAGTYKFRKNPRRGPVAEAVLREFYLQKRMSVQEIANELGFSTHKVGYWMDKYHVPTRGHSEATYVKKHPKGDPFTFRMPKDNEEHVLFGLGLGLYWGEGNKANQNSIRLGNTDPKLLVKFIEFLETFFNVPKTDLRFGLQIFTDINQRVALDFWTKELRISKKQFYKVTVTKARSLGTYRHKSQYGVLTVHYHNKKARDILNGLLPL